MTTIVKLYFLAPEYFVVVKLKKKVVFCIRHIKKKEKFVQEYDMKYFKYDILIVLFYEWIDIKIFSNIKESFGTQIKA